ncbi:MAG: leucine-rich repeat protein, partial [Bacteroides sp.]|nr:leucine-rich repeat protein [Eubacterium sp.]MCM1417312.1 leucine-rich repeat protein [Roseburia sp.]MCM1461495.1 leucine-rich repeat protein [Bacteroides sp.]
MKLWKRLAAGLLAGVMLTSWGFSSSAEEKDDLDTKIISISTEATKSKPGKVKNITSEAEETSVKLKWTASQGATSYIVKYSTDGGKTWKKKTTKKTSKTFTGLKAGKEYCFKVAAKNSAGTSAYSEVITVKAGVNDEEEFTVTPVSELIYEYNGNGVTITGYTGNSDTLYIPNEIRGFPVTIVKLYDRQYNFKNLILPVTTMSIALDNKTAHTIEYLKSPIGGDYGDFGQDAFSVYKSSLKKLVIPDGATKIKSFGFASCANLKSVTFPDTITMIGPSAFSGCQSLTSITLRGNGALIYEKAFKDCTGLTSVTIMDGVISIGNEAFKNCSNLKTVKIPDSVTSISTNAFEGCTRSCLKNKSNCAKSTKQK